ncbi:helix-turn-helix transcriptional regulator [Picosynechococcus sp. NKBG15041c]|uniref:helix-turn-helix transcriptional regulator n=1 Tax=Picosynechococcus sp. NKBG15041c TaxID=1407650 RepID=UPI000688DB1C|nr:helix-turn-helix transcriptional regulator [Picosynechococcus sp. NKBG15041c]
MLVHKNQNLPKRVINAWLMRAQNDLIAEAIAIDDYLLVFSCAMEKLEIPFDSMNALKCIAPEDRGDFEVDIDGSYLYWEKADIHLDLDAFRCAVDPVWRQKAEALKLSHDKAFGQAIAKLREQYKLHQSDIKGVSMRQVSRIENGESTKLETLELFTKAHSLEVNEYLEKIANLINV